MAKAPVTKRKTTADGKTTIAAKRGNGTGSVYWVAAQNRYRATFKDPATGKRRFVTGRTIGEAEKNRAAKLEELKTASPEGVLGPDPTVEALGAWWLSNVAGLRVRPGSLATYRKDVERINDVIGSRPIVKLDAETVRYFLAELRRDVDGKPRFSHAVVKNTRGTLRQIAECAVELEYLATNPVTRIPTPAQVASERTTKRVLTADEVHRLLSVLDGTRAYDPAVAVMFTAGCRVSEVLGLAWSDVDLKAGTAHIRRACTHLKDVGAVLDKPKTVSTAGIIQLAPTAVALLKARRKQQAQDRLAVGPLWATITYEGERLEMVFTTKSGELVLRQHVDKALRVACRRAGIDPTGVGTHTGRRSTVTRLYVAGVPLDDIARHVGHATPTTTAKYVQDLGDRPAETARKAWALLDPAADAKMAPPG